MRLFEPSGFPALRLPVDVYAPRVSAQAQLTLGTLSAFAEPRLLTWTELMINRPQSGLPILLVPAGGGGAAAEMRTALKRRGPLTPTMIVHDSGDWDLTWIGAVECVAESEFTVGRVSAILARAFLELVPTTLIDAGMASPGQVGIPAIACICSRQPPPVSLTSVAATVGCSIPIIRRHWRRLGPQIRRTPWVP
jgi:hypothetical protein